MMMMMCLYHRHVLYKLCYVIINIFACSKLVIILFPILSPLIGLH